MDSFMAAASDLDSILDQFERDEDSTSVLQPEPVAVNKSTIYPYQTPDSTQVVNGGSSYSTSQETSGYGSVDNRTQSSSQTTPQHEPKSRSFLLDLSEADFAPAAPQTLSLNSLGIKSEPYQPMSGDTVQSSASRLSGLDAVNSGPPTHTSRTDSSGELFSHMNKTATAAPLSESSTLVAGVTSSSTTQVTGSLGLSTAEPHVVGNSNQVRSSSPSHGFPSATLNVGNPDLTGVGPTVVSQPLHTGTGQVTPLVPVNPLSVNQLPGKEEDSQKEPGKRPAPDLQQDSRPSLTESKDVLEVKPLSKNLTPAPLRPELMHEYVKQGARPKIISSIKTPESPAKAANETMSPSKPSKGVVQPKPPVGFSSVKNVKVTEADLEALEQEVGIMPLKEKGKPVAQPVHQPQPNPTHLSIEDLNTPGDRVSPVSKLLNEQYTESLQQEPTLQRGNELAGLDPFFSKNVSASRQDTLGPTVHSTSLLDSSPVPQSGVPLLSPSLTAAPVEAPSMQTTSSAKDPALPNDVLSKNAKNLLRNNQAFPSGQPYVSRQTKDPSSVNNSNSQIRVPNVAVSGGQVPSSSPAPPQGIPPAVSAPSGTQGGQPQHHSDVSSLDPISKNSNTMTSQPRGLAHPAGFPASPSTRSSTDQRQSHGSVPAPPFMPADPPSYQDVRNSMGGEGDRRPEGLRQGLTLNFDQPGPRKLAQALPPSPIIEDVQGREDAFRVPEQGSASESLHLNRADATQQSFQTPPQTQQTLVDAIPPTLVAAPNAVAQNNLFADNDSVTTSNETDSEQGDFNRRVIDYSEGAMQLGAVAPVWVPDSEALNCMNCQQKFTFRKRRHHCRACGKVFCAKCCSMRLKLKYMESKEARVCISCLNVILRAQALQRTQAENQPEPTPPPDQDNLSNISNTSEGMPAGNAGNRSSLRRPSNDGSRPRETRKVRFSDGVNPGVEQNPHDGVGIGGTVLAGIDVGNVPCTVEGRPRGLGDVTGSSLIPGNEEGLPPVVVAVETGGEYHVRQNLVEEELIQEMKNPSAPPVAFALNRNLIVRIKILDLNCCVNRTCWCFSTKGMATVGQDEIVIVLECLTDEKTVPKDIFRHLQSLYEQASRGVTVSHMGHSLFSQSFLGGREHGGFLYLRPSFQCLSKLLLPEPPYLFAVLLQKWETPWAKVFPLRLLLRLGAEFRYYPCPLMSVRFRKPVFGEIGHTIMNLLADFKNYQYKLPVIPGIVIHMQERETLIQIPRNRYNEVMKVVNNSNEHVMAIAANFSTEADSHLVCIQNDEGTYQTQAISIQNKPRKVTGASFVVFNGALKTTSGLTAKSSIVEDGLMIQILPETMAALRQALRDMLDLPIPCGATQAERPDETVTVKWVDDDKTVNVGVLSPIDGRSLEGVDSIRIHHGNDFRGGRSNLSLRWTEVFFLENEESPVDQSRLAEMLSSAFCAAMTGQLDQLQDASMVKLALRVTVDSDSVGYEAGSKGELLPPVYMNELDNELIPVLHSAVSQHEGGPVIMELVFYIIE
ncbi:uncharacterized protein LOC110978509 [Acanthaster planci]|uniref:Uncharacterized protein LOC110978509 n=1 Tax=Acanthaster planci TaxID=133434 RepID=A0A8B7YA58_ACAPL|nr:uncharacterized protein LOC110978509 [Acanthaster planci]XP_022089255.1 uncharacterized protein LOC110978509 [Acanthaster planci]XP_022089257.1 uncharacterized protein LOC110978509 [Acanthaster planci]XP_022089258.1 uncharacterized protein LOC110978509 [Acanthaster planci]